MLGQGIVFQKIQWFHTKYSCWENFVRMFYSMFLVVVIFKEKSKYWLLYVKLKLVWNIDIEYCQKHTAVYPLSQLLLDVWVPTYKLWLTFEKFNFTNDYIMSNLDCSLLILIYLCGYTCWFIDWLKVTNKMLSHMLLTMEEQPPIVFIQLVISFFKRI